MTTQYSPVEIEKLEEFKGKVSTILTSEEQRKDYFLIRWLRARDLDINKAEEMLKKSLEWRKMNTVDGILEKEDFPDKYKKIFPFGVFGTDEDGCPILFLPMGKHDHKTLLEKEGMEACIRFNIIWIEKLVQLMQDYEIKSGKPVSQYVEIIDLEGYSYRQASSKICRDYILESQRMFDENYPEILKSVLVINAPKIFAILWTIIKSFVPKQTLDKIDIYGPDAFKWKQIITERFPTERIPPHWGGTMQSSDEFCSQSDLWFDGPVPLGFFRKDVSGDSDEVLLTQKINARDRFHFIQTIAMKNTIVEWKFKTEDHDIGFQILFGKDKVVLPYKRLESQKEMQLGSLTCDFTGNYTFVFDNKYSYTRSKTLYYKVYTIEPEHNSDEKKSLHNENNI